MLFKRSETIVYGSTHTTTASLNGSIWISIETVSSRRAARWRHSRITIQFSVVWSRTFGPGSIPSPFETYEKHHHNQNQYDNKDGADDDEDQAGDGLVLAAVAHGAGDVLGDGVGDGLALVARHVVTGHDHKVKKSVGGLDPGGLQAISEAII